jgi:SPP1 family predicted phage head-tail adaptor
MSMAVGAMRHTITVQSATNTTDAGGGRAVSYSTIKTLLAHVKHDSGREKYEQGVLGDKNVFTFTTRYVTGITTAMIIGFNNQLFQIRSIINVDERNRYLVIKCDEGVAT